MASNIGTHELKHKLSSEPMSRDELNKALSKLAASSNRLNTETFATCYVMSEPDEVKIPFVCARCGRRRLFTKEDPNLIKKYELLAQKFIRLGYKATVSTYCNDCIIEDKKHLAQIVFSFQASGMEEPSVSFPNCNWYEDSDYLLALDFLKGVNSARVLSDLHHKSNNGNKSVYERIKAIVGTFIEPFSEDLFEPDEDDGELPF